MQFLDEEGGEVEPGQVGRGQEGEEMGQFLQGSCQLGVFGVIVWFLDAVPSAD